MISLKESVVIDAKVLASSTMYALCYRKGNLYRLEISSMKLFKISSLPNSKRNILLSKCGLTERLLRLEPRAAISLDDATFIFSYSGKVFRVDVTTGIIVVEHTFRRRMNNPLNFVRVENVAGVGDSILYGEYFSNNDFEEVNIWQRKDGNWSKAYTFPAGSLYHIHSLVPDKENGCIYALNGDSDAESGIWKLSDNFTKSELLFGGSQQYRSCVAFPFRGGLLYATDTPHDENHIYDVGNNGNCRTARPIYNMPGPCIYGLQQGSNMYFSTSVEADDTLPAFRYRFSYKLGLGVKDRFCHVIQMDQNGTMSEIVRFKKDIWPMLLFQFGNCLFPDNRAADYLMLCPQSVQKYHGKTILIKV